MRTRIRRICVLVGTATLLSVLSQQTSAAEIKIMTAEQIEKALFHKTRAIRPVKKHTTATCRAHKTRMTFADPAGDGPSVRRFAAIRRGPMKAASRRR